jgi:hypothetical protein
MLHIFRLCCVSVCKLAALMAPSTSGDYTLTAALPASAETTTVAAVFCVGQADCATAAPASGLARSACAGAIIMII